LRGEASRIKRKEIAPVIVSQRRRERKGAQGGKRNCEKGGKKYKRKIQ